MKNKKLNLNWIYIRMKLESYSHLYYSIQLKGIKIEEKLESGLGFYFIETTIFDNNDRT